MGQVGTGYAWKLYICLKPVAQLYICCAAATLVSGTGTRVALGLHPRTATGVKVFLTLSVTCVLSICVLVCVCVVPMEALKTGHIIAYDSNASLPLVFCSLC